MYSYVPSSQSYRYRVVEVQVYICTSGDCVNKAEKLVELKAALEGHDLPHLMFLEEAAASSVSPPSSPVSCNASSPVHSPSP